MCTITFIARRHGYALGMNRDERLTRVAGRPAVRNRLGGREALFPSEPNGGTWVGVNDSGATFALINWYSVAACVAGETVSRGEVVKSALPSSSAAKVDATLAGLPLSRVNAFRLLGVFPQARAVVEWRWNLHQLERLAHPWQTNLWLSSGFDEPGAQRARGKIFAEALRQKSAGTAAWLRRLQRSHGPGRGPYSICMHREDAATVSYTEVAVSRRTAMMRHTRGAPCCTAPQPALGLVIDSEIADPDPEGGGKRLTDVESALTHAATDLPEGLL